MSDPGSQLALPVRYTRSIHLVCDFANDRIGVRDYQATPLVLQTTERILEGLTPDGTARVLDHRAVWRGEIGLWRVSGALFAQRPAYAPAPGGRA